MEQCNFKDLENSGYMIIPNFLERETIEKMKDDYSVQKKLFLEKTDTVKKHSIIKSGFNLSAQLAAVISQIRRDTDLNIGNPMSESYFDNQVTQFPWHQDHEPYFKSRDLYNAVNFWIPIIKPSLTKSGISLLPQTVLQQRCPGVFAGKIIGKGAKVLMPYLTYTKMRDDDIHEEIILPFNIEDVAITPVMAEGDLLIFRQDVIHKTQDFGTERVAYSTRCFHAVTGCDHDSAKFSQWLNR